MIVDSHARRAAAFQRGSFLPGVRVLPALTVVALCASVAGTLLGGALDVEERPFPAAAGAETVPVRLLTTESGPGVVSRTATVLVDNALIRQSEALELIVGTYETSAPLRSAALTLGECTFTARADALANNAPVIFRRAPVCVVDDASGSRVKGQLLLSFSADSARDAQAAVWATRPAGRSTAAPIAIVDPEGVEHPVHGRSLVFRSKEWISRAALLAFMWEVPPARFWGLVAIALALPIVGVLMTLRGALEAPAAYQASVTALVVGGLALLYALLVPPLQAADEPDHLLGWGTIAGRANWNEDVATWARRVHFERLKFQSLERFRPAHREKPYDVAWSDHVFAENVARRSSTAARWWGLTSKMVPARPPHALLLLRILNVLVLTAAFVFASWLAARTSLHAAALFALLLIPTLPMFGVQLSESTWTVAAYVLLAGAMLAAVHGRVDMWWTGLALGVAFALLVAGPRSGWPAVMIVGGVLAGRLLLVEKTTPRDVAWFWAALAAPAVVLLASRALYVPQPDYNQWHVEGWHPSATVNSITVAGGTLILAALCAAIELATSRLRAALLSPLQMAGRILAALLAVAIVASLGLSMFLRFPRVPALPAVPTDPVWDYVWNATATVATAFRLRDPDFLTWTSLWGAFGWIDRIMPAPVLLAVGCATAIAGIVSFSAAWRERSARAAWMSLTVASLLTVAAACAFASHSLGRDVHGRYLLPVYILLQAVMWSGVGIRSVAGPLIVAAALALHAYALRFVLLAYFG